MLWKLDSLFDFEPTPEESTTKEETRHEENEEKVTESKDPDEEEKETTDPLESDEGQNPESEEDFASVQLRNSSDPRELAFAETLALRNRIRKRKIKSAYRKLIAQYHPDRVSAMGSEIKELAEAKTKEINEAYDFFRNKFEEDR